MKRTSAEIKRIARGQLTGHFGLPMGAMLVSSLITSGILFPFQLTLGVENLYDYGREFWMFQLASYIISLVATVLYAGLSRIHLALARGEVPAFSELFSCFHRRPDRFILAGFFTSLMALGVILPGVLCIVIADKIAGSPAFYILGLILLLAGLALYIVITLTLGLVQTLLAEHDSLGVMEAFRQSARLMRGNKGRLFYINLSFIGWTLLAFLSCGLGFLWLTPYMYQTSVVFYLDVTKRLPEGHSSQEHFDYRI